MIHKEVEVYVDNMIVKSKDRPGHIVALESSSPEYDSSESGWIQGSAHLG